MCGIFGSNHQYPFSQAINALSTLQHRGPDETNFRVTESGIIGHTRLAIIDRANSQQPMTREGHHLTYNGEIYNYQNLKAALQGSFETEGDTEVLLQQLSQQGPSSIEKLDGMFAFGYFGPELLLARDPLGIKPLYLKKDGDNVVFGSEMKALRHLPGTLAELPPGSTWSKTSGYSRYFDLDKFRQPNDQFDDSDVDSQILQKLTAAVRKRLIADPEVPIGVSLSGGLDSSLIAAIACASRKDLKTFSVGVNGSEDLQFARQLAAILGTEHHEYFFSLEDMHRHLSQVIYYLETYDAPLVRSAIPNYMLAKFASQHVKVILTGEGADEIFGGYEYLANITDPVTFQNELWMMVTNLHNTNLQRTDRMTMAFGLEARVPFLDKELVRYVMAIPPAYKFHRGQGTEKTLLRRAFKGHLPDSLLLRQKQKFSKGAGSSDLMREFANNTVTDAQFSQLKCQYPNAGLRSKEEAYYFTIFQSHFGDSIPLELIGRTRSITPTELR